MKRLNISIVSLLIALVSPLFSIIEATAESAPQTAEGSIQSTQTAFVRFADDRLTVEVSSVPLDGLLREIARQSGLNVVIHGSLEGSVSMKFDRLSFDKGLRRILRRHSFVIEYAGETPSAVRPEVLWILAGGEGVPSHQSMADADIKWTSDAPVQLISDTEKTGSVVDTLADIGDEDVIQDLATALQAEDASFRTEVMAIIDEVGSTAAADSLAQSLLDSGAPAQDTGVPSDS